MQSSRPARTLWPAVTALSTLVIAAAVLIVAGVCVWELRAEHRDARFASGLDAVWRMSDEWNSSAMLDTRAAAAGALLNNRPTADLAQILAFFATLKLLLDHGAINEELTALTFYDPLAHWWLASRDHVQTLGANAPRRWHDLEGVVQQLAALEAKRTNRVLADVLPAADSVRNFLLEEQGDEECSDDGEAQKTPL